MARLESRSKLGYFPLNAVEAHRIRSWLHFPGDTSAIALCDPLTLDIFLEAAEIYRTGRRKGYTIRSATDCLIAAIAIENDVPVWHRDRDFRLIARYTRLPAVERLRTIQ